MNDALHEAILESVRFTWWAAGEGMAPAEGEPSADPADIMMALCKASGEEDIEPILAHVRATRAESAGREGWRPANTAPEGQVVQIRIGSWVATARLNRNSEDGEGGRFPDTAWEILHYNSQSLQKVFYGSADMQWRPAPTAPCREDGYDPDASRPAGHDGVQS